MSLEVDIKKRFSSFQLDVTFEAKDETLGFLGASGCGKSLTMRCIAGIETPDEGRIVVNGQVFFDSERRINLKPQQRKTALLFQNYMLFPNLTVAENVGAGIGKDVARAERDDIVQRELKRFGLQGFDGRYPAQLSGGQQQRVSIARAIVNRPPLLICDEPTGNLDPQTSRGIMDLLERINRTGTTVLVATHDREMVDNMRRRVIALDRGHLTRDQDRGVYGFDV